MIKMCILISVYKYSKQWQCKVLDYSFGGI